MSLSIVIAVRNGANYVESCLYSLFSLKTNIDIEVIIVNDGSTDNTQKILKEEAAKYHIVLLDIDSIVALGARLKGASVATGDYIYFLDIDDTLSPDFFIDIPNEIASNSPDIILFGAVRVFHDKRKPVLLKNDIDCGVYEGSEIDQKIVPNLFCTHDLYGKRKIMTTLWSKVFKRELLLESTRSLKDRRIVIGEDLAVSVSVILKSRKISILPNNPYYNYLTNPNSLMNNYKKNIYQETAWLCDYLESLYDSPSYLSEVCYERAFFAISAFYNEFFYKSNRTLKEKRKAIMEILEDRKLKDSIRKINLDEVKFPNSYILKSISNDRIRSLMSLGIFISCFRLIIAKFVLS